MTQPRVTSDDLLAVQQELLELEPIFHRPAFGSSRADYDARMVDDYWEVGASGRIYERDFVLEDVVARGKVEGDEHWVVSDPCCRSVGDNTYALTYELDQDGRITRRMTLWRRAERDWQIVYHQGTIIHPGPDD